MHLCCLLTHVQVPLGTVVKDGGTGSVLRDLVEEGEVCVLAEGGEGGVGNAAFATAACRRTRESTEGGPGQEREVELELKTIADIGMVSVSFQFSSGGSRWIPRVPQNSPFPKSWLYVATWITTPARMQWCCEF